MQNLQRDVTLPTVAAKLKAARKQLRQEFPGARNLTRTITRALDRDSPGQRMGKGGRPAARLRVQESELAECCRALREGRLVHGQRRGVHWTAKGIQSVRCCAKLMARHNIKDARTLMHMLLAHSRKLEIATPRVKPEYRPDQKRAREAAAVKREEACEGADTYHQQTFMLDEGHAYRNALLCGRQQRSVVPKGMTKDQIVTEPRIKAGAADKSIFCWLAVINPYVGPVAMCFAPPRHPHANQCMKVSIYKRHALRHFLHGRAQ